MHSMFSVNTGLEALAGRGCPPWTCRFDLGFLWDLYSPVWVFSLLLLLSLGRSVGEKTRQQEHWDGFTHPLPLPLAFLSMLFHVGYLYTHHWIINTWNPCSIFCLIHSCLITTSWRMLGFSSPPSIQKLLIAHFLPYITPEIASKGLRSSMLPHPCRAPAQTWSDHQVWWILVKYWSSLQVTCALHTLVLSIRLYTTILSGLGNHSKISW